MGICNLTPDSFSDGGQAWGAEAAKKRVDQLIEEGADVLDLGGESTRPGAPPVADDEQLRRIAPALEHALARGALVSIDTQSPRVADDCLRRGAHVLNDVSCLRDERLADVVVEHDAAYVLMHARDRQETMAGFSAYPDQAYGDVVRDVTSEWQAAAARAIARGVRRDALVFDPGLGFSKNARHSAELLARTGDIVRVVLHPVLIGASRKSFLAKLDKSAAPSERVGASIAAALHSVRAGASALRVHDVRATRQALDFERLVREKKRPTDQAAEAAS